MPVVGAIGGALIGGIATASSARSQSRAVRDAANTQAAASSENIAAAERERARNEALFRPEVDRGNRADAYLDALYYGDGAYTQPTGQFNLPAPVNVSRADALAQINANPLIGIGEQNFQEQNALADQGYADTLAAAAQGLGFRNADALIEYAAQQGLSEQELTRLLGESARARADQEQTGQENYAGRLSLLEQDYLRRQGFTDAEIAAWEANASAGRDRAVDSVMSRFGVTGRTGQATRGVADVEQQYGRDRAMYEAGLRRSDYDQFASGRYSAYDDLARANENAGLSEASARWDAYGRYGEANRTNAERLFNRRAGAYDQYEGINLQGLQVRDNRRFGAQGERNASRLNAYGDWTDYMQGNASRGQAGRGAIAGAGQTTLGITNSERTNAARAAADAAYARANINANTTNQIAQIAGNAYGQWNQTRMQQPQIKFDPYAYRAPTIAPYQPPPLNSINYNTPTLRRG